MPDPITAAVAAVKGGSAILQKKNIKKAAKKTAAELAAGQEKSLALQKEMYDKQVALQNPFLQSGNLSNAELMRQMGVSGDAASQGYGNMLRDFGTSDFEADPGYAFRLQEGLKALDRTAAMRGKMISGQALKAAGRYGQDMASQEYQNAYNRYNTNNLNRYNMLAGQQNVGMNAADRIGQAGQFYATGGGANIVGASKARASQYQPIANASNTMIGSLGDLGNKLLGNYGTPKV
jgi:hypothetical protein